MSQRVLKPLHLHAAGGLMLALVLWSSIAHAQWREAEKPLHRDWILEQLGERFDDRGPGCLVALYDREGLLSVETRGSANLDYGIPLAANSRFYMASISKQVTSAMVALLMERGALRPEDRVADLLDEWPDWASAIQVHHLYSHTSGLSDLYGLMDLAGVPYGDPLDLDRYMELIHASGELMFEPGSEYAYSNSGYTVLAALIEQATGESFARAVKERLLEPLGMHRTHFHDDRGIIVPYRVISYGVDEEHGYRRTYLGSFQGVGPGGLYSSAEDWARWEAFMLGSPQLEGERLSASEAAAIRDRLTTPARAGDSPLSYGMGLELNDVYGLREQGHSGSFMGFRHDLRRYPSENLSILTLCNREDGRPDEITKTVAGKLLSDRISDWLSPLEGSYYSEEVDSRMVFDIREGALVLQRRVWPNGPLQPEGERLQWRSGSWQFEFEQAANGDVTGLRVHTGRVRNVLFLRESLHAEQR